MLNGNIIAIALIINRNRNEHDNIDLLTYHLVADFTIFTGHKQIEAGQYNGVVPMQWIRILRWVFRLLPFAKIAQESVYVVGPRQTFGVRV